MAERELAAQPPVTMERTVTFEMSVRDIAEAWCKMSDDGQARFFVECARIMAGWDGIGRQMQACYIGRHLRDCECIDDAARELVSEIYHFMTDGISDD